MRLEKLRAAGAYNILRGIYLYQMSRDRFFPSIFCLRDFRGESLFKFQQEDVFPISPRYFSLSKRQSRSCTRTRIAPATFLYSLNSFFFLI